MNFAPARVTNPLGWLRVTPDPPARPALPARVAGRTWLEARCGPGIGESLSSLLHQGQQGSLRRGGCFTCPPCDPASAAGVGGGGEVT